jgi:polyphosphate:AMP phosphotransferase
MFETAELGRKLSKEDYEAALPALRTRLLKAQAALEHAGFSVVVLLNGVGGMAETNNRLHEWLDARYLVSETWSKPTDEERARPEFWRFWRWLPPSGRIGVFLGNWYTRPIVDRAEKRAGRAEFAQDLQRITAFEQTLSDDSVVLIKLWFHLSERQQRRRLKSLEADPATRFRVKKVDWKRFAHYDQFREASEQAVRETNTGSAPWLVIEGADERYRDLEAGKRVAEVLERRLAEPRKSRAPEPEAPISNPSTILDTLDLAKRIDKAEYDARMPKLQGRLRGLAQRLARRRRSAIILFEGPDAAGKGGAIRRLTWALDALQYRVIPIGAPTEEERAHHYLWRFWRHLPGRGHITIYDRSWYGRVLVERVEGFATREEWSRAYKEINDFEHELTSDGIIVLKFWLQVSSAEQLLRFQDREKEPWKQHKITTEDYRNRLRENLYEEAASDMIERNSTEYAPFVLVPADDKRVARLEVIETVCRRLEAELE